jgi:hypothetical protein
MAKVYISYVIDGGVEVDIPDEVLANQDELQEYLNTHFENVDSQVLYDGLNMNDADSIVVKSVYDDNQEYFNSF